MLQQGPLRGEVIRYEPDEEPVVSVWYPDPDGDENEGFVFDLFPGDVDDMIALLTALKAEPAVDRFTDEFVGEEDFDDGRSQG